MYGLFSYMLSLFFMVNVYVFLSLMDPVGFICWNHIYKVGPRADP